MTKELSDLLKYLRLGNLLAHWEDYLKLAADKNLSHARFLTHVLEEEYKRKRENARQLRLKHAHIPEMLVIETSDLSRTAFLA
jgi:DNA replication protein DnaC